MQAYFPHGTGVPTELNEAEVLATLDRLTEAELATLDRAWQGRRNQVQAAQVSERLQAVRGERQVLARRLAANQQQQHELKAQMQSLMQSLMQDMDTGT